MTGSGNDFVVLDGRFTSVDRWPGERVRAICDRRTGAGADGLVILTPSTANSVRMAYWNSDGSHGAMCGNAALCSGRISVDLEMVPPGEFCLLTDAGQVRVRSHGRGDEAEINLPDCELPQPLEDLGAGKGELWRLLATVGVPHLVIRVEDIEAVDVLGRGRPLRSHPLLGSDGANINFISPSGGPGQPWLIRTYERGVEGETLACGTGTVAAALALASRGEATLPLIFRSRGGLDLGVRACIAGTHATDVWLRGQGKLVYRGVWEAH
jgi:diaminopimelate epimerase